MSDTAKTLCFVALAAISLIAAFLPGTSNNDYDFQSEVGKSLNQFDVEDAKRLRIVSFDPETAATREFEIAEEDDLWTIPSKQGYPADAVKQMAEAATCLIDREVLRIAAQDASQHVELGLIDPTSSNLDIEAAGAGTRVSLTNIDDAPLADMIIGKEVPDSEGQRYVRNADQDVAYVVNLQTDALTTRFEDWIEKDLLKLNPLDIRQVHIKDYSAEFQPVLTQSGIRLQPSWDHRGELELIYDDDESKWTAKRLQEFDTEKGDFVEFTLDEKETLNEDALRELRNGLDDLEIVDVERKPSGLSADLKAGGDFVKNQEAQSSLIARGFAPLPASDGGDLDILSSEGEITCTLADGVEYVLRFGNLQMQSDTGSDTQSSGDGEETDDGIHRYLFLMARYNDSMIERPELAELPELPAEPSDSTTENDTTALETAETEEDETASDESEVEQDSEAPAPDNEETADGAGEDAKSETLIEGEESGEAKDSELSKIIAERKAIEDENQRLLEEYQKKVDAAKQTVKELNERFGDWYYVIDNKVYNQIHLGRDDVIQVEEDEEAETDGEAAPAAGLPGLPNLPVSP